MTPHPFSRRREGEVGVPRGLGRSLGFSAQPQPGGLALVNLTGRQTSERPQRGGADLRRPPLNLCPLSLVPTGAFTEPPEGRCSRPPEVRGREGPRLPTSRPREAAKPPQSGEILPVSHPRPETPGRVSQPSESPHRLHSRPETRTCARLHQKMHAPEPAGLAAATVTRQSNPKTSAHNAPGGPGKTRRGGSGEGRESRGRGRGRRRKKGPTVGGQQSITSSREPPRVPRRIF